MVDLKVAFILKCVTFGVVLCQNETNQSFCNCRLKVKQKIVNGKVLNGGHVPWFASLAHFDSHICGSTILNGQFLLTATHVRAPDVSKVIHFKGANKN